ncbi:MAG: GNAT family N-acetyltransferase [Rhodospirillales bacterium]|nr:GNAT family N-acetyltransferase [Alphaproteobacteria bacterium]MBL6947887.1 GNAT family N-acetyltransferase [Rhodospirillales bacterium]
MHSYPKELEELCTLPDGRVVCLRPIRPEDEPEHYDLLAKSSPSDRRFRFFASVNTISQEAMDRFTHIDYDREMAFIACTETDGGGHETLGVVRTINDDSGTEAEFAIIIRSDIKHQGLGHALMGKAIRYCGERGISRLMGQILADNTRMLNFARKEGFKATMNLGEGVYDITLDLQS